MNRGSVIVILLAATCSFSSCMDGGKGKRSVTPALDSVSDTLAGKKVKVPDTGALDQDIRTFVFAVAADAIMETEAADLVLRRTKDKDVSAYAQQMRIDHGKVGTALKTIARQQGAYVPDTLSRDQRAQLSALMSLNDKAFENQYITMMIAGHGKMVRVFEDGMRLQNPDLQAFAKRTLPLIRLHRELAVKLGKQLNISNTGNGDDLLGESPAGRTRN